MFLDRPDVFHARGPAVEVHALEEETHVDQVLSRGFAPSAYVFVPAALHDPTPVVEVTLAGIPVRIAPATGWRDGVLEGLVDHFLHAPGLEVPIEPFASLARRIAGGGEETLWDTYHERLGRDYFVDEDGRVSLSERWARRARFFGRVGDDVDAFEASALWLELGRYREAVFATPTTCATCEHFLACGGFWLAGGEDDASTCRDWRAAMTRLAEAWRAHHDTSGEEHQRITDHG